MKKTILLSSIGLIIFCSCANIPSTDGHSSLKTLPTANEDDDFSLNESISQLMVKEQESDLITIDISELDLNHIVEQEIKNIPSIKFEEFNLDISEGNIEASGIIEKYNIHLRFSSFFRLKSDEIGSFYLEIASIQLNHIFLPKFLINRLKQKINIGILEVLRNNDIELIVQDINLSNNSLIIQTTSIRKGDSLQGFHQTVIGQDILITTSCTIKRLDSCLQSQVKFIDLNTFTDAIAPLNIKGYIPIAVINPDDSKLAILSIIGEIEKILVFEINETETNLIFSKSLNVFSMTFGVDDNELITGVGSKNGLIQFWDLKSGEQKREPILIPDSPIFGLAINRQKEILYTSNMFGILEWNLSSEILKPSSFDGLYHAFGQVRLATYDSPNEFNATPIQIKISSDGNYLLSQGQGNQIIWSTKNHRALEYLNPHFFGVSRKSFQGCGGFISDSPFLITCGLDTDVYIYNIESEEVIATYKKDGLYDLNMSSNGRYVVLSFEDGKIIIYDLWKPRPFSEAEFIIETENTVDNVSINQNGIGFVESNNFHFYNRDFTDELSITTSCNISNATLDPNQDRVALGCENGTIKIYDLINDGMIFEIENIENGFANSLIFKKTSHEDSLFALYQSGVIFKIDLNEKEFVWEHTTNLPIPNALLRAAISPNGKYIAFSSAASSGWGDIGILEIDGQKPEKYESKVLQNLGDVGLYWLPAFSPNGNYLAYNVMGSNEIIIYDIYKDKIINRFSSSKNSMVFSTQFLSDRHLIISTSSNDISDSSVSKRYEHNNIEVWDIFEGKQIAVIEDAHSGQIISIIDLGSERFISSSLNGEIKNWNISEENLETIVCSKVKRDLSENEKAEYMGSTIRQSNLCSDWSTINIYEPSNEPEDIEQILKKIFGPKSEYIDVFADDFNKNLSIGSEYSLTSIVENDFDQLIIDPPAILQCRNNLENMTLENDYLIFWPMRLDSSDSSYIGKIDLQINAKHIKETNNKLEIINMLPPGQNVLFAPNQTIDKEIVNGEEGFSSEINLMLNDFVISEKDYDIKNDISVEYLSSHSHPNIYLDDINFPMHSLQLWMENDSDYAIDAILIVGIVYDQNDQVIDLLWTPNPGNLYIKSKESMILTARSFSDTGRCVGYSDPNAPYKIRYWVGMGLHTNSEIRFYETIYGEEYIN